MKIAFDIGGVLSKQPHIWRPIVKALLASSEVQVFILSDMKSHEKAVAFCHDNDFKVPSNQILVADYETHGELCKAVVLKEYGIDMHVDDFPGYLTEGCPVRLLVMADPYSTYYHPDWKTDGSEGDFGRRRPAKK